MRRIAEGLFPLDSGHRGISWKIARPKKNLKIFINKYNVLPVSCPEYRTPQTSDSALSSKLRTSL